MTCDRHTLTRRAVQDEARIHVQSEDEPDRTLLETKIAKDDGYQKQQGAPPAPPAISDRVLMLSQIRSSCGQNRMSPTWRSAFRSQKDVQLYGGHFHIDIDV